MRNLVQELGNCRFSLNYAWCHANIIFALFFYRNDEETNSKGEGEEHDDSHRSPKDGEDRPSSSGEYSYLIGSFHNLVLFKNLIFSGVDDEESAAIVPAEIDPNLAWPSMQDLNTRLRRVITSYQRNYKKEEMKQQQKAKVRRFSTRFTRTLSGSWDFIFYVESNHFDIINSTLPSFSLLSILSVSSESQWNFS